MDKPKILLLGAGGHARACIDVIEQENRFTVGGLLGLPDEVGTEVFGYPVIGSDSDIESVMNDYRYALVTVGQIKSPDLRISLFERLEKNGCEMPVIISPRAYVSSHAVIQPGTIVMHGAIVNSAVRIGKNCIINSLALIEHDSEVRDHCHISTSASLNSGVRVGAGTFVGSNTSVRQGIEIGERCVIGMGQTVVANCQAGHRLPMFKG